MTPRVELLEEFEGFAHRVTTVNNDGKTASIRQAQLRDERFPLDRR